MLSIIKPSDYNFSGLEVSLNNKLSHVLSEIKAKNPERDFALCTDYIFIPYLENDLSKALKTFLLHENVLYNIVSPRIIEDDWPLTVGHNLNPILNKSQVKIIDESQKEINITVVSLCSHKICLKTKPIDTVKSIKEKISKSDGIPVTQQRLIFKGTELEDKTPIGYYDIIEGSKINMMLNLRGGMHLIPNGHTDYCSTLHPSSATGCPSNSEGVYHYVINVKYVDNDGKLLTKEMNIHPQVPTDHVKRMIGAETDQNYFAGLTVKELEEFDKYKEQLSEKSLLRYIDAIAGA